jgi:hypothetical protein
VKKVCIAVTSLAVLVMSAALWPARPIVDVEAAATAELLALHKADRRLHFAHDVDALLATLPDTFTYVRDGKVEMQSKESRRKRFTEYFRGTEFTAWDDLEPPIVRASPDGKMGWMIVRAKIGYTKTDAAGKKSSEQAVMAWMSAYEKRGRDWFHVANITTVEPE